MTTVRTAPKPPEQPHRLMAGFHDNDVAWYDFDLYGKMAGQVDRVFFASDNPTTGLIAS